jgi:hypothetical protein
LSTAFLTSELSGVRAAAMQGKTAETRIANVAAAGKGRRLSRKDLFMKCSCRDPLERWRPETSDSRESVFEAADVRQPI